MSQSSEDSGQPWQNTIGEPDPQSFKKISKPSDVVIVGMWRSFASVAVGVGCRKDLAACRYCLTAGSGSGDGPASRSMVQAEGGQSVEVEGAGSGQNVGQDAFFAAAAGISATPRTVGEVADLAFHHGR